MSYGGHKQQSGPVAPLGGATGGRKTRVGDIMRRPAVTISATDSVLAAALRMRAEGVGILPVLANGEMVGVLTDRDIVTRFLTRQDLTREVPVEEVMSRGVLTCLDIEPIEDATAMMGDYQLHRLPVRDLAGRLVGVLSVDDVAEDFSEHLAGETLGEIVEKR